LLLPTAEAQLSRRVPNVRITWSTLSTREHDGHTPTVSVITPAFNAALYVRETLDSIRAQTFSDFEVIVIDDGSTDETAAVVESYALRDPRIQLIRQSNQGIAAARNAGIARARGRFLALLDSDDVWFPRYLEEQVAILRRRPEIAVLSANAINLGGPLDGQLLLGRSRRGNLRKLSLFTLVRAEDSMSILSVFRREVVDAIGGFDATLRRSEDYDFWLRAAAAGFRVAVNMKPLGLYRRRPDSMSADEVLMLHAVRAVLVKLRERSADRSDIRLLVNRQIARLTRRTLLTTARTALLRGDKAELVVQFAALAETTGLVRYRLARWLSDRVPSTIWWAYVCKRTLRQLAKTRRVDPGSAWLSGEIAHRPGQLTAIPDQHV
jgi:glycosyltransferase involved in cell wall biosynthesis